MEEKKKSSTAIIVILVLIIVALGGFIAYDKFLSKSNETTTNVEDTETLKDNEQKIEETTEKSNEKSNTIETRYCIGTYSGQGVVSQDAMTGQNINGTITLDLKNDGTYKLTKSDTEQYWSGSYTIIENSLLLKKSPDTCDPGFDCSEEKYASFLSIAEDCSKIYDGYGSFFFDSHFTLTKNN